MPEKLASVLCSFLPVQIMWPAFLSALLVSEYVKQQNSIIFTAALYWHQADSSSNPASQVNCWNCG